MPVEIVKVSSRKDLKKFIMFPYDLYKGCENWVPALIGDEFNNFNPKKNGAFEYCEADCFLAYKEGKIVGRVAAIINHNANRDWNTKTVRFGWFDFIEDAEVAKALTDAVADWGRERGCDTIKGPLGFTDLDKEGLLVEGYEHLSPFTCLYNYPYYDRILKEIGFEKDADWTQSLVRISDTLPPSYQYTSLVEQRFGLHVAKSKTLLEHALKYGVALFHLCNESFAQLFQFTPISDKQIKAYLWTYVPILSKDFVSIVLDRNEKPVGFAFCVPSLSKAVKKSNGYLFPAGVFRIFHALKHNDTLEALMIGVLPEYQGKGASLLMMKSIHENCIKRGIRKMIMNPRLEDNFKVQTLLSDYEEEPFMRRRAYTKTL